MEGKKEKSKQWWRWLLFIPVGLLFALIAIPVGRLVNYLSTLGFLGFADGILFKISQIIIEVVMLYISAVIAASVAPNKKIGGIVYASLMLVFLGFGIALAIIGKGETWDYYVVTVGSMVAMIAAIISSANDELEL